MHYWQQTRNVDGDKDNLAPHKLVPGHIKKAESGGSPKIVDAGHVLPPESSVNCDLSKLLCPGATPGLRVSMWHWDPIQSWKEQCRLDSLAMVEAVSVEECYYEIKSWPSIMGVPTGGGGWKAKKWSIKKSWIHNESETRI